MKYVLLAAALVPAISGLGQTGWQSFTSPDGTFRFMYPDTYALYTAANVEQIELSYTPVCDKTVVACVVYPSGKYEQTNFAGAAVQVSEVTDANTETKCLNPMALVSSSQVAPTYPAFRIPTKHRTRTINGIRFVHGIRGGAGSNHIIETWLFRTFHNHNCYELAVNITKTASAVYPPRTINEFTRGDEHHVRRDLYKVVDSFEFLK